MSKKINKKSNIKEVLAEYPQTIKVFLDYGLHCVDCVANSVDDIEQGAKLHGLIDEEIDQMLKKINEVAKDGK